MASAAPASALTRAASAGAPFLVVAVTMKLLADFGLISAGTGPLACSLSRIPSRAEVKPWHMWATSRTGNLERQIVGVDVIEQCPGPLVQHVGVKAFSLEQGDTALPTGPLRFQRRQFGV